MKVRSSGSPHKIRRSLVWLRLTELTSRIILKVILDVLEPRWSKKKDERGYEESTN